MKHYLRQQEKRTCGHGILFFSFAIQLQEKRLKKPRLRHGLKNAEAASLDSITHIRPRFISTQNAILPL